MTGSRLTPKLAAILEWCQRNPERRRREPLGGGLVITGYLDHTGLLHLLLSRKGATGPSDQECRTVLAHWPDKVPQAARQWTAFSRGEYQCRVTVWRPGTQHLVGGAGVETSRQLPLGATHEESN